MKERCTDVSCAGPEGLTKILFYLPVQKLLILPVPIDSQKYKVGVLP